MNIACLQPRAIQFDLIRGLRDELDVGAGQARLARVGAGQARLARGAQARLQANETNELQNLSFLRIGVAYRMSTVQIRCVASTLTKAFSGGLFLNKECFSTNISLPQPDL